MYESVVEKWQEVELCVGETIIDVHLTPVTVFSVVELEVKNIFFPYITCEAN